MYNMYRDNKSDVLNNLVWLKHYYFYIWFGFKKTSQTYYQISIVFHAQKHNKSISISRSIEVIHMGKCAKICTIGKHKNECILPLPPTKWSNKLRLISKLMKNTLLQQWMGTSINIYTRGYVNWGVEWTLLSL